MICYQVPVPSAYCSDVAAVYTQKDSTAARWPYPVLSGALGKAYHRTRRINYTFVRPS